MKRTLLIPLCVLVGVLAVAFAPNTVLSEKRDTEKIILVDLNVESPKDAAKAFSSQFDRERVVVDLPYDDPLFTLEDYALAEDALDGPDCFLPQLKMIFREDTYIFSMYCTSVVRYRNTAPYKTSSKLARSDIKVTESVLDFLQDTHKKYFDSSVDPNIAKRFHKTEDLKDVNIKVDDSALYEDDDAKEDKELEKDAIDKEGWFDETVDPGLEPDDKPIDEEGGSK